MIWLPPSLLHSTSHQLVTVYEMDNIQRCDYNVHVHGEAEGMQQEIGILQHK